MSDFRGDERGIALNLLVFIVGLIIAAGMVIVLNEPMQIIIDQGQTQTSSADAQQGWEWIDLAWQAFPLAALILATIGFFADTQFFRRARQ